MLIYDFCLIGNKLLEIRKSKGLTQAEVAEAAGLSDRTYADIERGTVNMRTATILKICETLCITPDEILTRDSTPDSVTIEEITILLDKCSKQQQKTALAILQAYLTSLNMK